MANQATNYNLAPLRNVSSFLTLAQRLEDRGAGLPGMGCFYGPSGYGKTTASLYSINHLDDACAVQCKSVWTKKKLCESICQELGLEPAKTIADMVDQISDHIARHRTVLIIDEADYLVQKGMIEIVRDLYESSFTPIILIGEEQMPQKLSKWERVHGRILSSVRAEPADDEDFDLLQKIRCPGVTLSPELVAKMKIASRGSARRIVANLELAREIAATLDVDYIGDREWDGRDFFTGAAPQVRRGLN